MLLIRLLGNDYTISREAVNKLLELSKPKRISLIDVASMYPSIFRTTVFGK